MTEASELLQAADLPMDPADMPLAPPYNVTPDVGGAPPVEEDPRTAQARQDLDERARDDFIGLLHLGYLEETCTVAGHRFRLRTPTHDERIERGMLHRPHIGSLNYVPMWELITVATYCVQIDGQNAPEPLGPAVGAVATRLDWIKHAIASPTVIGMIYRQTVELDARESACVEYLDEQGKA